MTRFLAAAAFVALATCALAGAQTPPPTVVPDQLTVGVSMPSEGFQVGFVRGTEVVLAQGLEIDLARALALGLGFDQTAFVQSRFDRLFSAGQKPWDIAIGQIRSLPSAAGPWRRFARSAYARYGSRPVPRPQRGRSRRRGPCFRSGTSRRSCSISRPVAATPSSTTPRRSGRSRCAPRAGTGRSSA